MSREVCGICWCPYDEDTGECACEPESKAQHMIDLRTAAQQALKILELEGWGYPSPKTAEAITALKTALAEPDTCVWQQDGDSDSGFYGTSCKRYFDLNDGTPEDNKMAWCCYCGKKLAQKLITEDEDD